MNRTQRFAGLPALCMAALSLTFLIAPSAPVDAATIVNQRISATNRLIPLTKITVGPYDQYEATHDGDNRLVFTRKADLVANLQIQDLRTGEIQDLLPLNADSQEPVFSPSGQLAFTYYRFNARGDVCFASLPGRVKRALTDQEIRCLQRPENATGTQRSNPFWKSETEIGFIERDVDTQATRIVAENIRTGARTVLIEGRVWSPSMRPGGRYLAYNELVTRHGDSVRQVTVRDLHQNQSYTTAFALPGLSGFPQLSPDEKYLYFSHYLNDTNDDRAIDGGDNAVVFRIAMDRLTTASPGTELVPEQLTSAETSCSFPRPSLDSVYVTCAFEGSLDVYRMPMTGVVPADWNEARLGNALQTSRTYQERILLLNALKNRGKGAQSSLEDRWLSNHLFSDDTVAARYYLSRMEKTAAVKDKAFLRLLGVYLEGRELKKAQPSDAISREFQRQIQVLDRRVAGIEGERRFRSIVRGLLRDFVNDIRASEAHLREVRFDARVRPLERYFYFELAQQVHRRNRTGRLPQLVEAHRLMMAAPDLSHESRLYYAVSMLELLQETEPSLAKRRDWITRANRDLPAPVASLLESEAVVLRLIGASDEKTKSEIYRDLDKLMSQSRGDYFLRKSLYVRAILNFTQAAEFKTLSLVATNWLRYTSKEDTEFIHARDVVSHSALDRAYENLGKNQLELADNFFYQALSLTDDLEAHAGYIRAMVRRGQRTGLDSQYKNLQQRQFIDDNMKFVEALIELIDAEPEAAKNPEQVGHLKNAIEKLEEMKQDRDSPVRHLLLGYSYMEMLLRRASGAEFDADLFQKAHRSLMLAYDLGRDNVRIKASALMNLGILHQRVQNHGLAAKFFSLRKPLGFTTPEEEVLFAGLYARSLGRSHQTEKAALEIAGLPENRQTPPLTERMAFYSMNAAKYKESAAAYERLLQSGQVQGDRNLASVHLVHGFDLFKLQKEEDAKASLQKALEHLSRLAPIAKGKAQLVEFEPVRLQMAALGLLSQMGSEAERRAALEQRIDLLSKNQGLVDEPLPKLILAHVRLADLYSKVDGAQASASLATALSLADEYGSSADYVSSPVFRGLSSYLAHGLLYPQNSTGQKNDKVRDVVKKSLAAYANQKIVQPMLDYQNLKLQVLWAAYSVRVLGQTLAAPSDMESVLSSSLSERLKASQPAQWEEVQKLAAALRR